MVLPSPLEKLSHPLFAEKQIEVFIKRDDQIHPDFGGNKYRKLKYQLSYFRENDYQQILTFGGAFSNHIRATAAICNHENIPVIGVIRGSWLHEKSNDSLAFASEKGMDLRFTTKEIYAQKNNQSKLESLFSISKKTLFIPEGGTNERAVKGCQEIVSEINQQLSTSFDTICLSCGTGGTTAGIVSGITTNQNVLAFSALKNGEFLKKIVLGLIGSKAQSIGNNLSINCDYVFGGYAKKSESLIDFMHSFYRHFKIELDFIYNGKMWYGLFDLIGKNYFPVGHKIVVVNTGGLPNGRVGVL